MGIRVPAGECNIVFTYETPGLKYGLIATVIGSVLLVIYVVMMYFVLKEKPVRYAHLYNQEQTEGISAHKAYIRTISRTSAKKDENDKTSDNNDKDE